jgi:hypothetical protein
MKNLIKFIFALILTGFTGQFISCNFLDVDDYFNETLKMDSVFHNKRNLEKYLWGTANYFYDEGEIFGNTHIPGITASDEGFSLGAAYNGLSFVLGEVTETNAQGMDIWGRMYQIVRKANTMFARIDEAVDLTSTDKRELLGYIHFLRGYAYYHLLLQYGPVVLLGDEILESNETVEYYARTRSTYDESIEYICADFEKAADFLPSELPINFFGRPTRGAALGLIARLRLQHASPLFNGQQAARTYFGSWTRSSDGVHYVSQTYDENRWAVAALAAKRIIDWNIYSLHIVNRTGDTPPLPENVSPDNFPYGAGNIDPFHSYSDMFTGEALAARNPEYLWGRISPSVLSFTQRSFPVSYFRGFNNLSVPQKIIDAYYMADGRDISNSSNEYPYPSDEQGYLSGADRKFSGYTLKGNVHKMYANREMRFYASIGFSGCLWTANSTSEASYKNQVIFYNFNGNGGKAAVTEDPNSYPITGYVLRKYIHPDDAWAGNGATRLEKPFPIIRYAEILLSYVEALNNLTTSHTLTDTEGNQHTFTRDTEQIKLYFNQIRYRAGLPGLTDEEAGDPATVQNLIERERMIEFLHENRRFYDVRRWGKYEDSENELMMGMDTDSDGDAYYTRVPLNHSKARNRIVDKKLIFFPIPKVELRKATTLDQNPGWSY